jgi:dihydroorotase
MDPGNEWHGQTVDIRVTNGEIAEIGADLSLDGAEEIRLPQASVSTGWIDLEAIGGDPGFEHREDIASLTKAAAAGGFTKVGLRPETDPVIHDKSGVSYLLQQARFAPVELLPIGAVSKHLAGAEITEMLDMRAAGAVAFSDGSHSIQHAGLLLRALLYVKTFDGLIMNQPQEATIAGKGQLHEGMVSTMLGMRGIPSLAEELMIDRDLRLLEYTDSRLHISHVSTAEGVEKIRAAKAQGLRVTASVAALNLLLTVKDVENFNSNCKVLPPLREEKDRQALLRGLKDGTIDCISSNHTPLESEAKHLEFAYADFGAATISTAFSTARHGVGDVLTEEELISKFTSGPRRVFQLEPSSIAVGNVAQLTFYQYDTIRIVTLQDIHSKSKNSPLVSQTLTGRPLGILNGDQFVTLNKL